MPADERCHHGVLGSRRTSLIWPWDQSSGRCVTSVACKRGARHSGADRARQLSSGWESRRPQLGTRAQRPRPRSCLHRAHEHTSTWVTASARRRHGSARAGMRRRGPGLAQAARVTRVLAACTSSQHARSCQAKASGWRACLGLTRDGCTRRARPSPVPRQRSLGAASASTGVGRFRSLAPIRHNGRKLKVWPKIGAGSFVRPAFAAFELGRVPAAVPDHDARLVHVLVVLPVPVVCIGADVDANSVKPEAQELRAQKKDVDRLPVRLQAQWLRQGVKQSRVSW